MSEYRRERHRIVAQLLTLLDSAFLAKTRCYFGGGTRLALDLDEYRESQDMDFLCSDLAGYRVLRSGVSPRSLGALLKKRPGLSLLRDVRADQYGIRTVLDVGGQPVKFEIVLEARIPVAGTHVRRIPVPVLDRASCFAEKWLANADRWNDVSVASRDAMDLAFMLQAWPLSDAKAGANLAKEAYGAAIGRAARSVAAKLIGNPVYRKQCAGTLAIDDVKTLKAGLKKLQRFAAQLK